MIKKERVIGNDLDAVSQIISLANAHSLHETRNKKHLLGALGVIAKMKPMTKPTKKLASWINRQMRALSQNREGYLAKIIHGDGASGILVGEVIAITVEDKDDIEKFKDYKPEASGAAAPQAPPASTPPNEKVVEKPVSLHEPKPGFDTTCKPYHFHHNKIIGNKGRR
nr:dihydrolipoyllysine-residue acetyltransferase component 2 of pyruvate dehydrogenase complex, mitochondrial-like [Tanacetum cinerariifolium]